MLVQSVRVIRLACIILMSLTLISCNATLHNYQYHEIPRSESGLPLLYAARTNEVIAADPSDLRKNVTKASELAIMLAIAVASNGTAVAGTLSPNAPFPGKGKHRYKNYELHVDINGELSPLREFVTEGYPTAFQPEIFENASGVVSLNFYSQNLRGGYSENIGTIPREDLFLDGYVPVLAVGYQEGDFGFGIRLIQISDREHQYCRGLIYSGLSKANIAQEIRKRSLLAFDTVSKKNYSKAYFFACNTVLWAEPMLAIEHSSKYLSRLERRGEKVMKVLKIWRDSDWGNAVDEWFEGLSASEQKVYRNARGEQAIILKVELPTPE